MTQMTVTFPSEKLPNGKTVFYLEPKQWSTEHVGGMIAVVEVIPTVPDPHPSESGAGEPSLEDLRLGEAETEKTDKLLKE